MWHGSGTLPADYGRPVFTAPAYHGYASPYGDYGAARKGGGKSIFDPGPPEKLWNTDPDHRKINVIGIVTGTMAGGDDELIVVAQGARTSFKNRVLEDRATIRGGVAALHAAGVSGYPNPERLHSDLFQSKERDAALVKAARGGRDIRSAADHMRKVIRQHGLERAAWGARGLYLLANLTGFQIVRGTVSTVLAVIPTGVTQIVAAAVAGHGAISAAVAKGAADKFSKYVKEGLASYRKKQEAAAAAGVPAAAPPASGTPAWLWWGGGAALLALTVYAVQSRRRAA